MQVGKATVIQAQLDDLVLNDCRKSKGLLLQQACAN